jgi:nitroimidazol reductase NimA-like FMN-containing flavoprotein (pyridoxamine 5'-phosphate oxidase superfamily)
MMRQSEREIIKSSELQAVLMAGLACHLAITDPGNAPYVVTMNYGFSYPSDPSGVSDPSNHTPRSTILPTLWFHCAQQGRKLDLLLCDPQVSFQIESRLSVSRGTGVQACDWSMQYESIVGWGFVEIVTKPEDQLFGLSSLMEHYGGASLPFLEQAIARTTVLRLNVEAMTGKRSRQLWPLLA